MTSKEKFQRDMLIVSDRKAGMSMSECAIKYNLANVNHICKRYGVGGVMSDKESPTKYECKVGEEEISKRIREQWVGFEYVRGCKGTEKPCIIRCITCGYEFEASLISLRQKDKQKRCPKCYKKELRAKQDARDMFVKRERERRAEGRELNRISNSTQIEFSIAECKECGERFIKGARTVYCSGDCARKAFNNHKDRRLTIKNVIDKDITLEKLYKRDNGICYICGIICDWNDYILKDSTIICGGRYPSIEHVEALSRGGQHSWANVKLACRQCNMIKRDRPQPKK